MWAQLDLDVEQNADYARSWFFYDADAAGLYLAMGGDNNLVPHDFTGASLKMQVRQTEQPTSTLIDTYSTATGEITLVGANAQNFIGGNGLASANPPAIPAYNNGFKLAITGARLAALNAGKYFFDVLVTVAGVNDYIFGGRFEVVARQTR